ncbi:MULTISPECIES: hypothetical protein [Bacillus cereus group]|uniref:Sigma-O factor regulatory protein RsoA n=1 Tax=Bacillus thuringiensis subsp. medellin TaxID=79672 RepID=A0A9X6R8Q5_BACTV|nr:MULTISPECIES: hypothetical protein [Bacillus cereus group]OUB84302.1 hypothetical protein BK784_35810 [Bacillus thuringiensis serovar medellin]WIK98914.1 hypothetical protein QPL86_30305 [Bacillus bombysepticus]
MLKFEDKNLSNYNYEGILQIFNLKIRKCLKNTPYQEREDLEQEIKVKIFEKISVINDLEVPGFFDFLDDSVINSPKTKLGVQPPNHQPDNSNYYKN